MKTKIFALLMILSLIATPIVLAEEPPAAPPEEKKAEAPAEPEKKGEEYDWKIGEKLTPETAGELIKLGIEAAGQKGSFWRNPALWELVFTILMLILGFLAARFGWKKKKWGKIIQAVEKAVNTVYVEFIREAKLKAKEAGGKLSKEDMQKAIEDAWNMTKDDLAKQGIDLAKWVAKEYFPVLVDKVLKLVKK